MLVNHVWVHEFVTEGATEAACCLPNGTFELLLAHSTELLPLVHSKFSTVDHIRNLVWPLIELLLLLM